MPPLCQVLEEDPSCYPQMRGHWFRCSGTIQEPLTLKPAINWKLLEHQSHCAQWSELYITMDWEGADQEWSSCSKIYDFKVWQIYICPHDQAKIALYCSDETKIRLFGLSSPENPVPAFQHGDDCTMFWNYLLPVLLIHCTNECGLCLKACIYNWDHFKEIIKSSKRPWHSCLWWMHVNMWPQLSTISMAN